MKIPSYPKVWALGHRALKDLFNGPVWVEEKIDGSQFSFALSGGELHFRSKRVEVFDGEAGMFQLAIDQVKARKHLLEEGYIYRGEFLRAPKHNTLTYDRAPKGNIVIWDIETSWGTFLNPFLRRREALAIGFEATELLGKHDGPLTPTEIEALLRNESMLGGPKIEGFVVKTHARFGEDGKILAGKFVSEAFKEKHSASWKKTNPGRKDVLEALKVAYRTEARWAKAVQHLRESGKLMGDPRDIGPLIKEVHTDLADEEAEEVKERLYAAFAKDIIRASTAGLAEWYKKQLAVEPQEVAQ